MNGPTRNRQRSQNSLDESSQQYFPEMAEQPVVLHYKNGSHTQKAFEVFNTMREKNILRDVVIVSENVEVPAHKMVLAAASPYFYDIFSNIDNNCRDTSENHYKVLEGGRILVYGICPRALQLLINFIYTSEINIAEDNVTSIITTAYRFGFDELGDTCCKFLTDLINVDNCIEIRGFAAMTGLADILLAAGEFISRHHEELKATGRLDQNCSGMS